MNHTETLDRPPVPAVSEYCRANVWINPVPELGVTEIAVTAPPTIVESAELQTGSLRRKP